MERLVAELILQPFRHLTYVTTHSPTLPSLYLRDSWMSRAHSPTLPSLFLRDSWMSGAHSPTLPSLYLRHNSFSNPSVALPTSQLILQPFRCFTYVKAEWAELILQPFRHFTYVTTHSPTLPSLHLRHSSFSNLSVASPTSQFILQPFFRFSYVTSSSLNSPGEPPMVYSREISVFMRNGIWKIGLRQIGMFLNQGYSRTAVSNCGTRTLKVRSWLLGGMRAAFKVKFEEK